jgi:hypothetical protein
MTCRQRIEAAMNLQEPDRVPTYDLLRNDAAIEHYSGEKLTVADGLRITCKAIGRSLDATRSISGPIDPKVHEEAQGSQLTRFYSRTGSSDRERSGMFRVRFERWTSWIEERPFRDLEGLTEFVKADIEQRNAWQPDAAFVEAWRKSFLQLQAWCGDTVISHGETGVGIDYCFHTAGWELFSYLLADDPGLISEWLEAVTAEQIRKIHAIADRRLSPFALPYGDIAYKQKLLLSPAFLRREFCPRLKRINQAWHEHGIKCLFHSDGYLMDILPDLIETGIDGLNPIERIAGMDLKALKEQYGKRLFFAGGIDVSQLMALGRPAEVKEACRQAIAEAGAGGGYWLGSTTELHNALPAENILALVDSAREFGRYPLGFP